MNFHGMFVPVGKMAGIGSSKQNIGFVDMLCEGPIYGLVDGKNSVFVDNISFENSTAVGSFTKSNASVMATVSSTGTTTKTYTVQGIALRDKDVSKLAIIEVKTLVLTSIGVQYATSDGTYSLATAPSGSFDSSWSTINDALKFGVLKSSNGSQYEVQISVGQVSTNAGVYFAQNPRNLDINLTDTFTLCLYQAVEIQSIPSNTTFTSTSSITNNVTNAKFYIRDKATFDSTSPGSDKDISKNDGSTLQFRRGTGDQVPIQDVNGVSAGVSITGTGSAKVIAQTRPMPEGFTAYDTAGYPTGQNYTEQGGAAIVIPASGPSSGPNFGLSAARRTQIDEVTIRINYGSLILYNNTNGDKEQGRAIYAFQIRTKLDGVFSPYKTLFSNQNNGQVVHAARTTAPVSFDHTIGLNRFKPFDDFDIRIIRLSRPNGRPVRADGSTEGNIDDWSLQAESSVAGADLTSTLHDKLYYPYTAHAAITFSSQTYNNVPSRSYHLRGLKVRIPNAYTPREETEDGVAKYDKFWNGKFKDQLFYTDNPAWVFYDIITNNRYGCGQWISPDIIDKYSLFRVAKYCDELVPSGNKDSNGNDILEPRFRANIYLAKSTEVYKVLKDMATVFIGMLYWLDGKLTVVQDVPGEPVANFSKANVVDGEFAYETSGRKTRINQCVVTWNDPNNNYEPVPLIVEDREAIVRDNRIISQSAVAMGATSEGQAYRYGKWKLWTAQNQKEIVSFKTGLQGAFLRPGDIINVQDRDRNAVDFSGVVKSATASSITFDRQIEVDANNTYEITTLVTSGAGYYIGTDTISIDGKTYNRGDRIVNRVFLDQDQDNDPSETLALGYIDTEAKAASAFLDSTGATPIEIDWKPHSYIVTKTVTLNTANPTVATIAGGSGNNYAIGEIPVVGTVWVLKANDGIEDVEGSKKEYRILSIGLEDDGNVYEITAAEHYNVKFDAVDKDYYLGAIPESTIDNVEPEEVPAPENVYIILNSDSTKEGEEITVSWDVPQSLFSSLLATVTQNYQYLNNYELHHNIPDLDSPIMTGTRTSHSFTGLKNDFYTFRVRAVSKKGNYSPYTSVSYNVVDRFGTDIPRVIGGLPKGIKSSSDIAYSSDPGSSIPEALRFVDTNPVGFSLGSPLTATSTAATSLLAPGNTQISLVGIANTANVERVAMFNSSYSQLLTWYFLLYDGGSHLGLWDTTTLEGLPFYRKISPGGWRGSAQDNQWINQGGTVSIPANSTRMTTSVSNTSLQLNDIIRLDDRTTSLKANYISAISIASSSGSSTTRLTASANHTLVSGDKILVEEVLDNSSDDQTNTYNPSYVPLAGLSYKEFYVTVVNNTAVDLYLDEARTQKVQSDTITGTPQSQPYRGWFRKVDVKAARIIGKVNNTTFILDRSFNTAISNLAICRHLYRPSFIDDAVYGRVKHTTYTVDPHDSSETNDFALETFIQLNESLTKGKLCNVEPLISAIQYSTEADGTTSQETEFTELKVKVKAIGFSNPQFRISNVTSGANLNVTNTNGVATAVSTTFSGPDSTGGNEKEFVINADGSVDYGDGTPIIITAEVREANNSGVNAIGSADILRIKDGASGTSGRVVNFISEDYSILYDEFGENPSFQSSSSGQIKLTATARNFSDPIFKIFQDGTALNNGNYYDPSGESTSIPAQPGFNKQEINYTVPSNIGSIATRVFEVQVAEKPENWNASSQTGQDSDGNSITPTVQAIDAFTIAHIPAGEGGPVIVNSNAAHAYATNEDGSFTISAGIPNSGTTLEVIVGGRVATYVGNTSGSSGKTNGQNGLASNGVLAKGEWYILSNIPTTSQFSAGNITGVSNNVVSIGNVGVPTTNPQVFGGDDEQITFTCRLGIGEGNTIDLKSVQSLSKSKAGAVGNNINFAFVKVPVSVPASDVVALGSNSLPNQFTSGGNTYTWSDGVPSGTGILYASKGQLAAGASAWNWATPFAINAKSVAELVIYTANVQTGAAPNVPTGSTFRFSDSTLTVNDSNWGLSVPNFTASGQTIYAARALVTGSEDETVSISWSTAFIFAQRIDGEEGDAVDAIFRRSNSNPGAPTASAGTPTGWSTNPPTGTPPLWMSIGTKAAGEDVYTWGTPSKVEGEAFVEVFAYRALLESAPNAWNPAVTPSATTWNFTNNTFALPSGWSQTQPSLANHGDKLYVILGTASGGPTNTGATLTWTAPVLQQIRQDGKDGVALTLTPSPATIIYNKDGTTFDPNGNTNGVTLTVTANVTGVTNPSYSWTKPSGATSSGNVAQLAFSANLAQASVPTGDKTFGVDISGTDSNGNNVSLSESIIVPVSIGGIANVDETPRIVTGYLYYTGGATDNQSTVQTAANNLSSSDRVYTFANAGTDSAFASLDGNFSHSPPAASGTRTTVFYAPYTATETLNANGEQSGTGTAVLGSVAAGISFTGLVTFNGDSVTTANNNTINLTQIDGANITTGILKSAGTSTSTVDGSAFTGNNAHSYFNLSNGAIATNNFRIQTNGAAAFRGSVTMNSSSSLTNSLTVGSGTGSVTISGSNQRIVITDASNVDRVIIGKLS